MWPVSAISLDMPEIVIAFDYGLRRIGIAVGDTLTKTARPLRTHHINDGGALTELEWGRLDTEIRIAGAHRLVVGCPYNTNDSSQAMMDKARAFGLGLSQRHALPLHWVDERYSSIEATEQLQARRKAGTKHQRIAKEDIDSAAAAIILERWLAGEGEITL